MSVEVTNIRHAHKNLTQERILDAAMDLMTETMDPAVPTSAIAARAGVTERTVYRHFESREALALAVWPRVIARLQSQATPETAKDLVRLPFKVFPELDSREELARAAVYSDVARQARLLTNAGRQASMQKCLESSLPDMEEGVRRRRAAVLLMISSAHGWSVLRDFGGLEGDEVALAAAEALAVLLDMRPAGAGGTGVE